MAARPTLQRPTPTTPPTKSTKAAKPHQHRMAQDQGSSYATALKHMVTNVAQTGAEARAGDMIVAVAVEKAEGMYEMRDGSLQWTTPASQNVHVEVSVRDGADERFIPGLTVHVTMRDGDGNQVASGTLPFLWHPWLYHYGANFAVPGEGDYTIEVKVDAPAFPRHDKENGRRFIEDVAVVFEGIHIEPGKA